MNGTNISDVTAVVCNWLTAESTLHAINSFRAFYPNVELIVVDDNSDKKDKSTFFISYNSHNNSPERMYDPDTMKLQDLVKLHTIYAETDSHEHLGKGEGNAIDLAMSIINTRWMFHFHSDYRFTKGGIIEYLLSKAGDDVCAVGEDKKKHPNFPALSGVVELIDVSLGKKYGLSYRPVIYHDEDDTAELLETAQRSGFPIAAGGYYTGRLAQKGYKVITIGGLANEYGVHLRWQGDEKLWNQYY